MIDILARILWVFRFFRRNRTARAIVLWSVGLFSLISFLAGIEIAFALLGMVGRLAFAAVFMISQFVFLFMFLSRSKTITIIPGEGEGKTLADYRGQPALVEHMSQWVTILRGDREFRTMGGSPPSGLLLAGAPGTGKTYLMQCLAGTANIAMHGIEGSGFRAMFWGVDVLKVIQFCAKARNLAMQHGACIAYIDEIDAIASSRGGVSGGGQGQFAGPVGFMGGTGALTTLLSQISGMGEEREFTKCRNIVRKWFGMSPLHEGYVFFVGATNRPDVLDPAIVRPGRLDKHIEVTSPDASGRKDIFAYYLAKIKHDEMDVDYLVDNTHGATPAAIEMAVMRDAVRIARFDRRETVSQHDLELALLEQATGLANPISDMPREQRKQVCIHEAGHAVALYHLRKDKRISVVSTVRRGAGYLGFMLPVNVQAIYSMPMDRIVADILVSMAGDKACEAYFGKRWTGASGDIEHVRQRMYMLVYHGVFGGILMQQGQIPADAGEKAQRFVDEQWDRTLRFCREHMLEIVMMAGALMRKHELTGAEATSLLEKIDTRVKERSSQ